MMRYIDPEILHSFALVHTFYALYMLHFQHKECRTLILTSKIINTLCHDLDTISLINVHDTKKGSTQWFYVVSL